MKTLTLRRLIDLGACAAQRDLFRETFGDSVDVTPELCVSAANKFDWYWAAEHLLSASALAEYERVTASAWAAQVRALQVSEASALAEYKRVTARTFGELYEGSAQS